MPAAKVIAYKGVEITIWAQTIRVGSLPNLWLRRPVEDLDILAIKSIIDAARSALAEELRTLRDQSNELLAS